MSEGHYESSTNGLCGPLRLSKEQLTIEVAELENAVLIPREGSNLFIFNLCS